MEISVEGSSQIARQDKDRQSFREIVVFDKL